MVMPRTRSAVPSSPLITRPAECSHRMSPLGSTMRCRAAGGVRLDDVAVEVAHAPHDRRLVPGRRPYPVGSVCRRTTSRRTRHHPAILDRSPVRRMPALKARPTVRADDRDPHARLRDVVPSCSAAHRRMPAPQRRGPWPAEWKLLSIPHRSAPTSVSMLSTRACNRPSGAAHSISSPMPAPRSARPSGLSGVAVGTSSSGMRVTLRRSDSPSG
jgi:hypothetical protein